MWFLKGRPTNIDIKALISSIANGYQQTSYRFCVQTEDNNEKVWLALPAPWAPHKPNGSIKVNDDNLLTLLEENSGNNEEFVTLSEQDIEIWERLRDLKVQPNIELMHVQELITWHLDDIGVMTFWAEPGKTYQISYTHKIASDSCMFMPTRLPTIIAAHKPEVHCKLWIVNGIVLELQEYQQKMSVDSKLCSLLRESQESLDLLSFGEWMWDQDTRINTNNWESSDDDWESDAE